MRIENAQSGLSIAAAAIATLIATGVACRPAIALDPADTTGLSDEFDGTGLADTWQVVNPDTAAIEVRDGALFMTPNRNVVWWLADQGPGVFREVTGNFRVSAAVQARKASDPSTHVDSGFQFAGLIARDPASDGEAPENYVFNVVGYRGDYLCTETKTTENDLSQVEGPPWPNADAELRVCRVDDEFRIYRRPIGGDTWEHTITYSRRDLPATLQVGPIAYTYTDGWDLEARFEYVRIEPVNGEADCLTD
jgi:hypothetical protein